jgi:hypothetical protein
MVRPERFELPTCCSGGNRSIQLSYGRARISTVYMAEGNGINDGLSTSLAGGRRTMTQRVRSSKSKPAKLRLDVAVPT